MFGQQQQKKTTTSQQSNSIFSIPQQQQQQQQQQQKPPSQKSKPMQFVGNQTNNNNNNQQYPNNNFNNNNALNDFDVIQNHVANDFSSYFKSIEEAENIAIKNLEFKNPFETFKSVFRADLFLYNIIHHFIYLWSFNQVFRIHI